MGMSASQARLLSITARLTDNENSGQDISYSKIQLADKMDQINADYLEALKATKLTVLTGFNDSEEVYTDISYGLMTGYNTVAAGKQYGQHLQRHSHGDDGCVCIDYLKQCECHHETHDEPFHYADDSDIDSQLLRDERRHSFGQFSPCLRGNSCRFGPVVGFDIHCIPSD